MYSLRLTINLVSFAYFNIYEYIFTNFETYFLLVVNLAQEKPKLLKESLSILHVQVSKVKTAWVQWPGEFWKVLLFLKVLGTLQLFEMIIPQDLASWWKYSLQSMLQVSVCCYHFLLLLLIFIHLVVSDYSQFSLGKLHIVFRAS